MIRFGLFLAAINGALFLIFRAEAAHHHDVAMATLGLHVAGIGLAAAVMMLLCGVAWSRS